MKNYLFSLATLLFFGYSNAQDYDLKNFRANVTFLNSDVEGTVVVEATGIGTKKYESIEIAARSAFFAILFRGIPGSKYKSPMIAKEDEFKNHPVILEILKDGYTSFLSGSVVV